MKRFFLQFILLELVLFFLLGNGIYGQTVWNGTSDQSWYNSSQTSFTITTPEQLAGFASLVNSGTTFAGATITLESDIWLNSNSSTTNNWIPIGGDPTATSEQGSSPNSFQGIFDGNKHVIYNMYVNKASYFQAGFFGYLKSATVKNIVFINPTLIARGMMGVVTGWTGYVSAATYIDNCMVINATITGGIPNGDNNIGGIQGAAYYNYGYTYVTNCGVTGTISGNYTGGLGGNAQYTNFTNCYFAGTVSPTITALPYGGLTSYQGTITNCYTNFTGTNVNGTIVTSSYMQSDSMITALRDTVFKTDCALNNGYPILKWMMCGVPVNGITNICVGESTTLTAHGYDTYQWSTGATSASVTVTPTVTTDYYVTGTNTGMPSVMDTVTVYVNPQAVITASVTPSSDGLIHGTITPTTSTFPCLNTQPITYTITPDLGWHISKIVANDSICRGENPNDGTTVNFTYDPHGTLGTVKVYFSNIHNITTIAMLNDGAGTVLNGGTLGLVAPWGNNGVYSITTGTNIVYHFYETDRYHLYDVRLDEVSMGNVDSLELFDIHASHVINVVYDDQCGILEIPYSQTFTSETGFPDCWNQICYNAWGTSITLSGSNSYRTPNSLSFPYYCDYAIAVMPEIESSIPVNTLQVSYALKPAASETYYIGIMTNPTDASTFLPVDTLNLTSSSWQEFTTFFSDYVDTGRYIAFKRNGLQYYNAYLDDIRIDYIPDCSPATNLSVSHIAGTTALLTWNASASVPPYYTIEYSVTGSGAWTSMTETDLDAILTGLTENTTYEVRVKASCGSPESDWIYANFTTERCGSYENNTIGTGTSVTNGGYIPLGGNYSYSQQIFTAEDLHSTPQDILSIALQFFSSSSITRNIDIYMGYTADTAFNLISDYIPITSLTKVYSGNVSFNNSNIDYWMKINLDSTFSYNGVDNLVVAIDDNTGYFLVAGPGYERFYTHPTEGNKSLYFFSYENDITPASPASSLSGLVAACDNIRFISCGSTSCIIPNIFTANNITSSGADLSWIEGGNSTQYEIEYKLNRDSIWTSAGIISGTTYTVNNFASGMLYDLRVRAVCSDTENSDWATLSLRTACGEVAIPFREDFESYSQNDFPFCWKKYTNGSYYPYVSTSSYDNHRTGGVMDFAYTPSGYNLAILPEIASSVTLSQLQINFWGMVRELNNGNFILGVMTNPDSSSTFVPLDTITTAVANTWEEFEITLSAYSGTGHYIAFMWNNGNSNAFLIDDVSIDYTPNCVRPTALFADNITTTTANLHWTERGNATAWDIEYGLAGFAQGTGTMISTTTDYYALSGLNTNTMYDFYVRSYCEGGIYGDWSNMGTFMTGQIPITVPFTIDFEDATENQNWAIINGDCVNAWYINAATNNTVGGSNSLYISNTGGTSNTYSVNSSSTVWAYRDITFTSTIGEFLLSFDWKGMGLDYSGIYNNDYLRVYIGTPSSVISTATNSIAAPDNSVVLENVLEHASAWTPDTIALSASYAGTTQRLYFVWTNDDHYGDNPAAAIDNISVFAACARPSNFTVNNITASSADLNWMPGNSESNWIIEYGLAGFVHGRGTIVTSSTNSYALTDLYDTTHYDIYIKSECSDSSESRWLGPISFITRWEPCSEPTRLAVDNVTPTTANVSWDSGLNESYWRLEYKTLSETDYTPVNCSLHNYALTGLTPNTSYDVRVKSICGDNIESNYSENVSFTTLSATTYTISVTYSEGGSVSPSGNVTVNAGDSAVFSIIPNESYAVLEATVDGNSVLNELIDDHYTFYNVSADHSFDVDFQNVSVEEFANGNRVSIFPNPATDKVEIIFNDLNNNIKTIRLYDMYGKVVKEIPTGSTHISIDVKDLSNGLYLLNIYSKEGYINSFKIVKE